MRNSNSVVTAIADGAFMVTWENGVGDDVTDGSGSHIRGQIFNADGVATTEAFIVNTTTGDDQGEVSLTTLADGRVVATWRDESGTPGGDFGNIRAQIVDPRTHAVNLIGTGLDDDWVGTRFIDTLSGNGGDDRMDGAGGNDHLFGGAGIDRAHRRPRR